MDKKELKKQNEKFLQQLKFDEIKEIGPNAEQGSWGPSPFVRYFIYFNSFSKLEKYYKEVKSLATLTNLGGNIYEQNSYIKIINKNNVRIFVFPPTHLNGDKDWTSYYNLSSNDKVSLNVPITLSENDE